MIKFSSVLNEEHLNFAWPILSLNISCFPFSPLGLYFRLKHVFNIIIILKRVSFMVVGYCRFSHSHLLQ